MEHVQPLRAAGATLPDAADRPWWIAAALFIAVAALLLTVCHFAPPPGEPHPVPAAAGVKQTEASS